MFVHGDLVNTHVFIEDNHVSGIIDWGDATVTDRHYEIGKLYFDILAGKKELLRVFLESSNWPIRKNFATQALGLALYRQAVGLTQHHTFNIFHTLPGILEHSEISSLDELAYVLFKI